MRQGLLFEVPLAQAIVDQLEKTREEHAREVRRLTALLEAIRACPKTIVDDPEPTPVEPNQPA